MIKNLYVVEITHTLVVLAEDEESAREIAWDYRNDDEPDAEVTKMKHVWYPSAWEKDSLVYHNDVGDITMEKAIEIAGISPLHPQR